MGEEDQQSKLKKKDDRIKLSKEEKTKIEDIVLSVISRRNTQECKKFSKDRGKRVPIVVAESSEENSDEDGDTDDDSDDNDESDNGENDKNGGDDENNENDGDDED